VRKLMAGALAPMLLVPGGGAAAAGDGGVQALHLVDMAPLSLPIVDTGRLEGVLQLKLVLDLADDAAASRAEDRMPVLRSAALSAGLEFARLHASGLRPVDAVRLDADMTAAMQAADPAITRVLIVEVAATRG